jgi:hypothetical protein
VREEIKRRENKTEILVPFNLWLIALYRFLLVSLPWTSTQFSSHFPPNERCVYVCAVTNSIWDLFFVCVSDKRPPSFSLYYWLHNLLVLWFLMNCYDFFYTRCYRFLTVIIGAERIKEKSNHMYSHIRRKRKKERNFCAFPIQFAKRINCEEINLLFCCGVIV